MQRDATRSPERAVAVIPARLNSTRLPRKLLLRETGRSVLEHTYRQVVPARGIERTVIATADQAVAEEVASFGGEVAWTSPAAASGTDRLAELAQRWAEVDILVNVQGDEPEIPTSYVDQLVRLLVSRPGAPAATLAAPLRDPQRLRDPSCVKVVFNSRGEAMYFSRSPIPAVRDPQAIPECPHWQHLGIYAYRRHFLLGFSQLPASLLEAAEQLEQLRILEAGIPMLVGTVPRPTRGIDTPADYAAFVRRQQSETAPLVGLTAGPTTL